MTVSLPLSHQMVFSRILTCKYQYKRVGSAVWLESGDSFQGRVAIPPENGTHIFTRVAFSSTRYGGVHVRYSLASTPNANSCNHVHVSCVLVYAIRSYARVQFAGVYTKCEFLRTGFFVTRCRLRETFMCMCPIRWRLRQMRISATF